MTTHTPRWPLSWTSTLQLVVALALLALQVYRWTR
jgi:hypothetical protein